jgi:hypothetical protein
MRAKLLALREGIIPSDEEFIPILEDTNIAATAAREDRDTSVRPENDASGEEGAGDEDDDNQVEGEIVEEEKVEDDQEFKDRLEELMKDLVKPPQEHLSTLPISAFLIPVSVASFVQRRKRSRKIEEAAKASTGRRSTRHGNNDN